MSRRKHAAIVAVLGVAGWLLLLLWPDRVLAAGRRTEGGEVR